LYSSLFPSLKFKDYSWYNKNYAYHRIIHLYHSLKYKLYNNGTAQLVNIIKMRMSDKYAPNTKFIIYILTNLVYISNINYPTIIIIR
jgi:hypothetical protein